MSVTNAGNAYRDRQADSAAVQAAEASVIGTAKTNLAASLSAAQAAYTCNDGGKYQAAINAAYATYDAAVRAAYAANEPTLYASEQQFRSILKLPL